MQDLYTDIEGVLQCSNAVAQVSDVTGRTCQTKPMRVPSVRRGSDRQSVGANDRKVLRDGDFGLWLWLIVTTKHSKNSDKSITIFFQTTKYFHRNTIHIDGVIVKVANRHGIASSLQQQPARSLHRWRGRRAAHLA